MKLWLLLLPGLGSIVFLMGSALYTIMIQSVGLHTELGASLDYWSDTLSDPILFRSIEYSLRTSVLGSLGAVILAYPIAMWLRKPIPGKTAIIGLLRAPMFVPGLVAAFLLINVISFHGILNESLLALGVIDKPLRITNDKFGWSVVMLQVWKNTPFALILLSSSINSIRSDVLDASADLGASAWANFSQVVFPLTIPALQAALILIFIGALGDFAFASIAGSRNVYSLSVLMHYTATAYYEWEKAAVIGLVIMVLSGLSAILITLMTRPFANRTRPVISASFLERSHEK
ncbi:putative ABC transporter, permease subunit [Marinomonas sp. MED121]|uniref:ABC transporter permease n=1 Tax=Marinomonas sp. MED121 TaxID=314277 RepID=UPI000069050C|nr:ABC transporter permease [Marinomonas sp. MED121]EAQ64681.1 putative ABC transporter, permease subunit [Marinomonas sp. MED121]